MRDEKALKWLNGYELGYQIWDNKYRQNKESFDEWLDRVSGGNKKIREIIERKEFLFGGRILSNRGMNDDKGSYSNCYVLPRVNDSIEDIYNSRRDMARTFSYGGGVGIDISNLSPRGARINNQAKYTSGAVSFMDGYSKTTEEIGQNGRRKLA